MASAASSAGLTPHPARNLGLCCIVLRSFVNGKLISRCMLIVGTGCCAIAWLAGDADLINQNQITQGPWICRLASPAK